MKKVLTLIAAVALFATAAMAETYTVTGHEAEEVKSSEYGLTQAQLTTSVGTFYFTIAGDQGYTAGQAYDYAQLDTTYSFFDYYDQGTTYYAFLAGSTVTKVDDDNWTATAVCSDGNTYNITIAPLTPITEPKQTINLAIDSKTGNSVYDGTADQGVFQLIGETQSGDYALYFAVISDQIAGTYTEDDLYSDYVALYHFTATDTTAIELNNLLSDAVVTVNGTTVTATIPWVSTDSILYQISYTYTEPTAATTENFTATDLTIAQNSYYDLYELYYGVYVYDVYATSGTAMLYMTVYNYETDDAYGVWSAEDADIYMLDGTGADYLVGPTYTASLTISKSGNQTTCAGQMLVYGDVQFNVSATGDATAVVETEASKYAVISETNAVVVYGAQGEYVSLYDMAGRMIQTVKANSDNVRINVAVPGVYVVKVNGESMRAIVK